MFTATLRGGVALACVLFAGSVVAADPAPLGARVEVSGEPNQATIRREDYSSECAHSLVTEPVTAALKFRFSNTTKFGRRELTLFPTAGKAADGFSLVYQAPRQEFTLYGERFAESPHVTQHETAIFFGSYALFAENAKGTELKAVREFLQRTFPHVRENGTGAGYYLVPISQLSVLTSLLSGKGVERLPTATPATPSRVVPGLVRTGRGTYYDFEPNGMWVTVYDRRGGEPRRVSLVSSADEINYASHAAILARMGVVNPERLSPVQQIDAAIAKTPLLLDDYGTPEALRGLQHYRAQENREAFALNGKPRPDEGRWGPSERASKRKTILWSAVRDELGYTSELPPGLRWYETHDPRLARAPVDETGLPSLRLQRPFLVLGPAMGADEEPTELRIAHDRSSLHLQLAHAHLGDFAFDLDRDGHIAGGILEFEYDANPPHVLTRVELVDEGMVSRSTGLRRTLTPKSAEWVIRTLLRNVPTTPGTMVTVERARTGN